MIWHELCDDLPLQKVKAKIKNKPELSIAIAGIFGLWIGLLIGRKNRQTNSLSITKTGEREQ
ncbi:MAG: hypothetical protein ABI686_01700 [Acidobacteriota bacterium]